MKIEMLMTFDEYLMTMAMMIMKKGKMITVTIVIMTLFHPTNPPW